MDVTVVMTEAATTPGFALDYAFGNKRRTARPKQLPLPSVAESLCGWHNGAKREVKKLGAALARHTGQEEGEAISHLWGRHSACESGGERISCHNALRDALFAMGEVVKRRWVL